MKHTELTWWHCITLLNGEKTKGCADYDGHNGDRMCIPSDLSGKSVVDFGTYDGYWAIECKKRGAQPVLAIDRHVLQTATLALGERAIEYLGGPEFNLDVPFREDVFSRIGEHDMVLMLGIIYHLQNPIIGLINAARCCKQGGTVIVESSINQTPTGKHFPQDIPLLWLVDGDDPICITGDRSNYVIPNPLAVNKLCRMAGLVPTGETAISENKCRLTVVCKKL